MMLEDLWDRLGIGGMHMQLDIPIGRISLGRSSVTTSVLITSLQR
jgi:hypothetical protein